MSVAGTHLDRDQARQGNRTSWGLDTCANETIGTQGLTTQAATALIGSGLESHHTGFDIGIDRAIREWLHKHYSARAAAHPSLQDSASS